MELSNFFYFTSKTSRNLNRRYLRERLRQNEFLCDLFIFLCLIGNVKIYPAFVLLRATSENQSDLFIIDYVVILSKDSYKYRT